ncbi:hypothetical protein [Actinoallomurus sp. NPDC050550]|uniref:hypothetical protein n=1 Tax=Actinoallomurus sp. NPDC050550 TaxID=3154937 RepID=UPI00340702FD
MPDVHLDPELAAGLSAAPVRPFDASGVGYEDLPAIRKERTALVVPEVSDERITITERHAPVRLRIYRPVDLPGILPCLYWIHGGGMIMGSVKADDARLVEYALAVPTEFHLYPGACHGWDSLVPDAKLSRRAVRERIRALRERMAP